LAKCRFTSIAACGVHTLIIGTSGFSAAALNYQNKYSRIKNFMVVKSKRSREILELFIEKRNLPH
jgi:acetolactate synthase regulatory subunit